MSHKTLKWIALGFFFYILLYTSYRVHSKTAENFYHSPEDDFGYVNSTKDDVKMPYAEKEDESQLKTPDPVPAPTGKNYLFEICMIIFIILYIIRYYIGQHQNESLAIIWMHSCLPLLFEQFSRVGGENATLVKESQSTFRLTCTGRVHCIGLQINLILLSRQDIFSLLYSTFFLGRDLVTIQVAMNEDALSPFVFAIIKNLDCHMVINSFPNLSSCTKPIKSHYSGLDDSTWSVLSNCKKVVPQIITSGLKSFLNNFGAFVKLIYITNQYAHETYKKVLHFIFEMPKKDDMKTMEPILAMVLSLIDLVSKIKVSETSRVISAKASKLGRKENTDADKKSDNLLNNQIRKSKRARC
ncbi:uncharacterized protein LOC126324520 [Schistocerca gregaria]|uniref:uncharacterized protein LOC126324520 n=1 Tax=Schistocerca gregaria TaxID=7010 RepID=UPI00211DB861|nr:uncharacterized protein LOC126324520 [Schistocerca gregaria]